MSQSRSTDDEDSEDTVTTAYLPTEVESTQLSGISVLTYSLTSVPDEPFNHAERQLERLLNQRNIIMNEYHEIRMNEGPVLTLFGVRITTGLDLLKSYSVLYWFFMCTRIIMRFDLYLFMALFGTVSTFFSSFSLASDYTYFLVPMVLALFLEVLIAVKQLYVILVLLPGLSLTSYESYSHLFGTLLSLDLINNDVRVILYVTLKLCIVLSALLHFMTMFHVLRCKSARLTELLNEMRVVDREVHAMTRLLDNMRLQQHL